VSAFILNTLPLIYLYYKTPEYNIVTWILLIAITIFLNISIIIETVAIKKEKEKLVLIANILFSIGYFLCHILVLFSGYSLPLLLAAIVLLFVLKSSIIILFGKNLFTNEKDTVIPSLGKQWFYLGLFDAISIIAKSIDKWVILTLFSYAAFAIYYNGSYEIPVFGLMLTAVDSILIVELTKDNNAMAMASKGASLYNNSSLLLASVVFPAFCFLFFYHEEFFTFVFSNKYAASIPVFLISIFVLPVRVNNFTSVLQASHRNDLITKGALIDMIAAIFFMLLFYPLLQIRGLALAFVLSTYIQCGYYLLKTAQLLNKKIADLFPAKQLLYYMLFSAALIGAVKYSTLSFSYVASLITGIAICLIGMAILLLNYFRSDKQA
jgi:O-antigen/teichoic acid export membrane protein